MAGTWRSGSLWARYKEPEKESRRQISAARPAYASEIKGQGFNDKEKGEGDVSEGDVSKEASPSSSAPSYETDFKSWFRKNYGGEYEGGALEQKGLSDAEYHLGQKLLDYYRQEQILDAEKSKAQQVASITYDKLLKYLPMQQKAAGLGGNLGATETAMIDAANRYITDMGSIGSDYAEKRAGLESAKNAAVSGVLDAYKTEAEQDKDNAYSDALYLIEGNYFNEPSEMREYIDNNRGLFTDEQYKVLDRMISFYETSPEEQERIKAEEEEQKIRDNYEVRTEDENGQKISFGSNNKWAFLGKDDFSPGDNFILKSGTKSYRVESGGEETDANVITASYDLPNDTVFACNQQIYFKHNGKVYIVRRRENSYKDSFNNLYKRFYPTAN